MRSHRLTELTTPELEAHLGAGGDIALIPVGCTEMHGPHMPIGTDTFVAEAFALDLAERHDAVVFPPVHYTWSGATDGFAGTVSVEPELVMTTIEQVALQAARMGFRRIALVSIHGPNQRVLGLTTRRFFEKHDMPILLVDPFSGASEADNAPFVGDQSLGDISTKEASMVLVALQVLGRGDLYTQEEVAYDDESPPLGSYNRIRKYSPGYYMQDPRQHAQPTSRASLQLGREYWDRRLAAMDTLFDDLTAYMADVAKQSNKGRLKKG